MLPTLDLNKGKEPMRNGPVDVFSGVRKYWPPAAPSNKVNGGYKTDGLGPSANRSNDPFIAFAQKNPIAAYGVLSLANYSPSGSAGSSPTDNEPMTLDSRPITSGSRPMTSNNWRMRANGTSNSTINGHGVNGPSHAQESVAGPVPQGSRGSFPQGLEQRPRFSAQAPAYQPRSNHAGNTPVQPQRRNSWELTGPRHQQRQMSIHPERALVQYGQGYNGLTARQPDCYETCLKRAFSNGKLEQKDYNMLAYRLEEMAHYQSEMSSKQQALEGGREEIKRLRKELSLAKFARDKAREELHDAQSDNAVLLSRNDQMQTHIQEWEEAYNGYAEENLSNQTETY